MIVALMGIPSFKYAEEHVPEPGKQWSLMCEISEAAERYQKSQDLIDQTISALVLYDFIQENQIVSTYYKYLDHGYPIPSINRELGLALIQPHLEQLNVYSRGRFGGWRYEVANQDHSFMQGVEIADFITRGIKEETYLNPNLVNSLKASSRSIERPVFSRPSALDDYEIIIAHYDEYLGGLVKYARHAHVYHKGKTKAPNFKFKQWSFLQNVGREGHTYLNHIVTNYNKLAAVTVFIQVRCQLVPCRNFQT